MKRFLFANISFRDIIFTPRHVRIPGELPKAKQRKWKKRRSLQSLLDAAENQGRLRRTSQSYRAPNAVKDTLHMKRFSAILRRRKSIPSFED